MKHGNIVGMMGKNENRAQKKTRKYFRRKSSPKPAHALGMFIIMLVLATSETKHNTITSIEKKQLDETEKKQTKMKMIATKQNPKNVCCVCAEWPALNVQCSYCSYCSMYLFRGKIFCKFHKQNKKKMDNKSNNKMLNLSGATMKDIIKVNLIHTATSNQ